MIAQSAFPDALVYVVDDEPANVRLITATLAKGGYRNVMEFTSGTDVLAAIEERQPDLLLLDLNMPVCDGYKVLAELEATSERSIFPTVVLTADASAAVRDRALAAGAIDFLTKPIELTELLLRCKNHLRLRMLHLALERQHENEQRAHEDRVEYLAFHDSLTGMLNRAYFMDELAKSLAEARSYIGVMLFDVDDFKSLNDSLGHSAGDKALIHLSNIVRDAVGRSALAARFGGDEFAVLLESNNAEHHLATMAGEILRLLSNPFVVNGHEIVLKCSFGVASTRRQTTSAEELLRRADVALYTIKRSTKGACAVHESGMDSELLGRLALISDVDRALANGELYLEYQPVLDLRTQRICKLESLLRWRHQTLGQLSPTQFIPIAEESGVISSIGDWVLRKSLEDLRTWRGAGHDVGVAINVSPRELRSQSYDSHMVEAIGRSKLDPRLLTAEITERTFIDGESLAIETLSRLRSYGISISMDDFGTGYSSLSYLTRLPLDELKLDRSFTVAVGQNRSAEYVIECVINLARNTGLRVVAEGVESQNQLTWLELAHCDEAQGYLIAKPMAAIRVVDFLDRFRVDRKAA